MRSQTVLEKGTSKDKSANFSKKILNVKKSKVKPVVVNFQTNQGEPFDGPHQIPVRNTSNQDLGTNLNVNKDSDVDTSPNWVMGTETGMRKNT